MAPPVPKSGRRGDLAPLALRDRPYREAHDASERDRETRQPRTWAACRTWFVGEWQASLPTRMHSTGVEADSALGSPRLAPAVAARTGYVSDKGWGVTGWDRDGQPRGMTRDGEHTRDPFLFYLERMLNSGGTERSGAQALVRWAYMGWDTEATALAMFRREAKTVQSSDLQLWETAALEALLERTIRTLWNRCQSEPVRYAVCRGCRQRECVCGQKSESQRNAEDDAA